MALEERIKQLEDFTTLLGLQQLKYPIDSISKSILKSIVLEKLKESIFDVLWNNVYYYSTWFESVDGYNIQSGTVTMDGGIGVSLATGAVSGNTAEMEKIPKHQSILRWDKKQRFRASFFTNSVTSVTIKICIAEETPAGGAIETGYGFKVANNALQGISANGTTETVIDLSTTVGTGGANALDLEARFLPGEKIIFLVNKIERGIITTNLPSSNATLAHNTFFNVWIKTNAAGAKSMEVTYFEYIQDR